MRLCERRILKYVRGISQELEYKYSMLTDYLEPETESDELKDFLDHLSNKTLAEVEIWNEQLREIGVEI